MSTLSEKFYGSALESCSEVDRTARIENVKKVLYGVEYKVTKRFSNRQSAENLYENIAGEVALVNMVMESDRKVIIRKKGKSE